MNNKKADEKSKKKISRRTEKTHAHHFFEKIAVLNALIDKGGEDAKDAAIAKNNLAFQLEPQSRKSHSKNSKHKKVDMLDSRARLPGNFETGKRR